MSQSGSERPHLAGVVEDRWNPCSPRRWAGGAGDTSSSRTWGTADPGSSGSSRGSSTHPPAPARRTSDAASAAPRLAQLRHGRGDRRPGDRDRRRRAASSAVTDRSGNRRRAAAELRPGARLARGDDRGRRPPRRDGAGARGRRRGRLRHRQRHRRHRARARCCRARCWRRTTRSCCGRRLGGRCAGMAELYAELLADPSRRADDLRLDRCVEHAPARCGGSWPATGSPRGRCC